MARKDIDTHALGTINFLTFFSSFKERVIIYTMYNGSRLRSKIIATIAMAAIYLKIEGGFEGFGSEVDGIFK